MGAEPINLSSEVILRLQIVSELMALQNGLDSMAPMHLEIDKRIKAQLDAIDANVEQQIKESCL
jgi:hypothetical protein